MNMTLLARLLGYVAILIGLSMLFSIPWAFPAVSGTPLMEWQGLFGLIGSLLISLLCGGVLLLVGRRGQGQLFRKEAMAVVGLSWVMATVLGALPYILSGAAAGAERSVDGEIVIVERMSLVDALFEAQSGFSTTGATVITDLDSRELMPACILFWRSTTQFLGGLGIIVLFVAILGQGSAGKALMRAEMPGPSMQSHEARIQKTAWALCSVYMALTAILTMILWLLGLSMFDALCHAFATLSTGGFSTHNASIGYFATDPNVSGPAVEIVIILFMIIGGTNFLLLYFLVLWQPEKLWRDVEWRTYIAVILGLTALVAAFGLYHGDYLAAGTPRELRGEIPVDAAEVERSLRLGMFQVVTILTTTGFGTADFDSWNSFSRGVLFLLMFVGGCAGSTSGSLKVIRHILFLKILGQQVERSFRPTVVRSLRLAGQPVAEELRLNILVYFCMVLVILVFSWMVMVVVEPDETWLGAERPIEDKLLDTASGIAATLNNVGPGLGTVGATQNYAHFSDASKMIFTWLMMIGRLEIFVILVLFVPGFWRRP